MVGCGPNADPFEVAPLVEHATSTIFGSLAASTLRMYKLVWAQFLEFIQKVKTKGVTQSLNSSHILLYLSFISRQGLASSTVISKFSALSFCYKMCKLSDPSKDYYVSRFLTGLKKLQPQVDVRIPVTIDLLHKMCDMILSLGYSFYKRCLYQAMVVLAFHGFLRPGEITGSNNNLQLDQCELSSSLIIINFVKFKHHVGPPSQIKIHKINGNYCPVSVLHQYFKVRGTDPGPLFCFPFSIPVSYSQFHELVSQLKSVLQVRGKLTPHSFRIGAATWAATMGYSDEQICRMGRWASESYKSYIRIPSVSLS